MILFPCCSRGMSSNRCSFVPSTNARSSCRRTAFPPAENSLMSIPAVHRSSNSYANLLQRISKEYGNFGVKANIKQCLTSDAIDSKRVLSRINTLQDLVNVLDDRDVINETNVNLLESLAEKLDLTEAQNWIRAYKKGLDKDPRCWVCGLKEGANESENSVVEMVKLPALDNDDELSVAMRYVSTRIGPRKWKFLARVLKIKEHDIEAIEANYSRDLQEQAFQALKLWRQAMGKRATMARLVYALRHNAIYRNDLAEDLEKANYRDPVIN